ncbi:MAG: hypothetical protein ABSC22_10800 [Roseiarcus sp.]|jgi:hypothetical protein
MGKFFQFLESALKYKGAIGLAGLIVLCALLVILQILQLSIFTPIGASGTLGLLTLIVRSVFWLATTAVVVSGLAYVLPNRWFIPVSTVEYALAIFRMIDPTAGNPIGALSDRFEPYVGFPFYSRESDHPSYWPARVWRDREALRARFEAFFGRADVQAALAAARAQAGDESSVTMLSSAPGGPDPMDATIAAARMFFNVDLNGDAEALAKALGAPLANEFLGVERARGELRAFLPNRVAILRLRNIGSRTVRNVTVDYEVAGPVYDTKLRAVSQVANEPYLSFEHRLAIPTLLAGQAYDATIWYRYQSVDERVFPDKINFIQELTQGFTISNIAVATGGRVAFKPGLLKDVPAYERLYDGDGRRSDNPERELAALFETRGKATAAAMKAYDEEHRTARDLSLDALASFPANEAQIENAWIGFQSPAAKRYLAVCVYAHPKGPYALLSSVDRDRTDFIATRTALAKALGGEPEAEITDRLDDICSTISLAQGFNRANIVAAFHSLEATGFHDVRVEKLHYRNPAKPNGSRG